MNKATPEGNQTAVKPIGTNKKERPGGGDGVKVKGLRFSKKSEGEGNYFDLLLIITYCVQARGRATVSDVYSDITERLSSRVHKNTLADALEGLKKQEILAQGDDHDGNRVYSLKRFKFNCSPAIANGPEGLTQELRTDATGALIIEKFTAEKNGKPQKPLPCDPVDAIATIILTDGWLGGQIWDGNDELQENYFEAGKYYTLHLKRHQRMRGETQIPEKDGVMIMLEKFDAERPLMFERTYDGQIKATHAHSVQNFFANAVEGGRPINENCTRFYDVRNYFGFTDIIFEPHEGQLTFSKRPIHRNEKGPKAESATPKYYECLKPGTELDIRFSFPTTNFITPHEVKKWLTLALRSCIRSMSPARGDQVGTGAKLKNFHIRPWAKYEGGWQEI
ncbi:MAG: hypothetical protein ACFFFC_00905 [Candidatus Thorarchaeota archaeon]